MKRVVINTRFLLKDKLEGIGWFTYETTKRLVLNHPEIEFHFLFDRPFDKSFLFGANVVPHVLFPPARHPYLWYIWYEFSVSRALKKLQPDLFISPDSFLSLKSTCKTLLVLHDLGFEHFPQFTPAAVSKYYKKYTPLYAKKASRIATVSTFSKNDIVKQYGIKPENIEVVYNGASEMYKPLTESEKGKFKEEKTQGKDYFIYAGSVHPRKNVLGLLKAFNQYKQQYLNDDIKLVIAGRKAWHTSEAEQYFNTMRFKSEVIFTGHLNQLELSKYMGAAYAMVYVSFFEGFGIPILESMQCGVPAICGNNSSMPEVGGDACIAVDVDNPHAISEAMQKMRKDSQFYEAACKKSIAQAKKFSWDKTAELLWEACMHT